MKISHHWLEALLEKPINVAQLTECLTQIGLEVGKTEAYGKPLQNIVIGCIKHVAKHPKAEGLSVCEVDVGEKKLLSIVCGADNIAEGMYVPVALETGKVGDLTITEVDLRGVRSCGMLCSAAELGIKEESSSGILVIPPYSAVGTDFIDYLQLNDTVIEIDLTPNRADCLSMRGVAREISALAGVPWKSLKYEPCSVQQDEQIDVHLEKGKHCSRYVSCVVKDLDVTVDTPLWMKERLRRCAIPPVSVVVDIMNYVMLSLGQPLHAFDFEKISGAIQVRTAKPAEQIHLLDDRVLELTENTLIISDDQGPIAVAGIMGGKNSAVSATTKTVFIESAYFAPEMISAASQFHGLHTEASHRFERGVDFMIQHEAIHYACELLNNICGGHFGVVTEKKIEEKLPKRLAIDLRYASIKECLGHEIARQKVTQILTALNIKHKQNRGGWSCTPPSYRFDIEIEEDLIEEIGRFYGYNQIPDKHRIDLSTHSKYVPSHKNQALRYWSQRLATYGYHEAISYSFSNPDWFHWKGMPEALVLKNPISPKLSVMRTSLFPGLLQALAYNLNRQQKHLKVFEVGHAYFLGAQGPAQKQMLAGLMYGSVAPEQWDPNLHRAIDFYDLKNDVHNLLKSLHKDIHYDKLHDHPFLHPQASARAEIDGESIAYLGRIHPQLGSQFEFPQQVWLFELDLDKVAHWGQEKLQYQTFSTYPSIRRDVSIIISQEITFDELLGVIQDMDIEYCKQVLVMDIYTEGNMPEKNMTLGLVFQSQSRTLKNNEIADKVQKIIERLQEQFKVQIKDKKS